MAEQKPNGSRVKLKLTRKDRARITKLIKAMNWPWQWDSRNRVWRLTQIVED